MTPRDFLAVAIAPGLKLLPRAMDSVAARALLLAIADQESGLVHRRQIGGPALSRWQFERAGVAGVLSHPASVRLAQNVCQRLDYPPDAGVVHAAMEHNEVLASAFGRLLLWTLPDRLPLTVETDMAWRQYLSAWRPGRPHPDRWPERYARAWTEVTACR